MIILNQTMRRTMLFRSKRLGLTKPIYLRSLNKYIVCFSDNQYAFELLKENWWGHVAAFQ